ncbi:MAG: LysR family transcriptional regulator [Phascolarctobacterium sp.]|nr:LysR family transcriptional regulator [Phascolarctobacterium sp.]
MELRVLKYFLQIVEDEQFIKAAESLHITQPTLSRQIAELEEELGVSLFNRNSRRVELTEEGYILARRAREILNLTNISLSELKNFQNDVSGTISIGMGEYKSVMVIPKIIKSFLEKYPKVNFDIFTSSTDIITERLDNGLLDMGLLMKPTNIEKLNYIQVPVKERWGVIMRADDPLAAKKYVTIDDLKDKHLIFASRKNLHHDLKNWFRGTFKDANVRFTSNLPTNGAIMVLNNLGYSLCIEGGKNIWDDKLLVFRPLSPLLEETTIIAWKKDEAQTKVVSRFIKHVEECLEKGLDEID